MASLLALWRALCTATARLKSWGISREKKSSPLEYFTTFLSDSFPSFPPICFDDVYGQARRQNRSLDEVFEERFDGSLRALGGEAAKTMGLPQIVLRLDFWVASP